MELPMRKIILICCLATLFTTFSLAQNYTIEKKFWNLVLTEMASTNNNQFTYKISGDTIINNLSYQKLEYTSNGSQPNWLPTQILLRKEDSKVFKYSTKQDLLLYDFTNSSDSNNYVEAQLPLNSVNVFPNPTNSLLTIEPRLPIEQKIRYKIINTSGQQVVESFERDAQQFTINISGLKKGLYFLEIQTDNGAKLTKKIERY